MKPLLLVAGLSLVPAPWLPTPTLLAQAPAAAPAADAAGIAAPWDISQTIAALMAQTARIKPLLDQIKPREWVSKGAPEAYVAQLQSAQRELSDVERVAQGLEKQPDRLTVALDTYFRLQSLETRLNSLVEGIRQFQNPAVGDLMVGVLGESAANREKLRDYISDLAGQKEQELRVIDQEAQRCRTTLNRQPAAARPAPAKTPGKAPAAPKASPAVNSPAGNSPAVNTQTPNTPAPSTQQ